MDNGAPDWQIGHLKAGSIGPSSQPIDE